MALYLTQPERDIIKKAVSGIDWHVHKSILSKIEADEEQIKTRKNCEHIHGSYNGKKECCTKCGSFFVPGMGFAWTKSKRTRKVTSVGRVDTPDRKRKATLK